ncbi:uncharacterized protein B0T15DRAFT_258900 [Chaetomium strumarium]|uniref:Uncharacterized protein n=1 Tax=Chaetomium strumarium TaxID=1170767 RepID=A0AAJ0LYZ8_9PEZI|nr:hypothetical protein B0T15DRAFT_258900 [Chaetomium strumarium]
MSHPRIDGEQFSVPAKAEPPSDTCSKGAWLSWILDDPWRPILPARGPTSEAELATPVLNPMSSTAALTGSTLTGYSEEFEELGEKGEFAMSRKSDQESFPADFSVQSSLDSSCSLIGTGSAYSSYYRAASIDIPLPTTAFYDAYSLEKAKPARLSSLSDVKDGEHEAVTVEDETESRSPTPWPESWYEGGKELGLSHFVGQVLTERLDRAPDIRSGANTPPPASAILVAASGPHVQNTAQDAMSHPPHATASSTTSQTLLPDCTSSNFQRKRPRNGGGGGGDDEDDDGRPPKRPVVTKTPGSESTRGPLYACPYQKRYPRDSPLCGMPHGSRREFGWETVSRVKQHLLESHGRDYHCSNCWRAHKKVEAAKSCPQTKGCVKRQSPPKLWLTDAEVSQLRAARFDSKSDDAWYCIFGLLFPDEEEHGSQGYRAKYTPCEAIIVPKRTVWDRSLTVIFVDYTVAIPIPLAYPSNGMTDNRSLNSMWTPSTGTSSGGNPTSSLGLTPSDSNRSAESSKEGADGEPIHNASEIQDAYTPCAPNDGLQAASTITSCESARQGSIASQFHTIPDLSIGDFPSDATRPLGPDSEGLNPIFLLNDSNPANLHSQPSVTAQETPSTTTNEPLRPSSCTCTFAPRCICRLKTRTIHLRRENEELRTEIETLRKALEGVRRTLEQHDEYVQDVEDTNLLPGEVMARLWGYQDKMRTFCRTNGNAGKCDILSYQW